MTDTVTEETETAEEIVEEVLEEVQEDQPQEEPQEQPVEEKKEELIPVSAQIAERRKRQEAEERVRWLEQQLTNQQPKQPEADNSDDLLTVGQQKATLDEWKRSILEEAYMEQNPEIVERVRDELPEILSDPRHKWLADTINQAPNRLQRAQQVLEMIKPKKQAAPPPNRANTPKSPQGMAKTNKLSIADRLMTMSDQELEDWRVSQKRKIR
jgi:hypothetical protein